MLVDAIDNFGAIMDSIKEQNTIEREIWKFRLWCDYYAATVC